MWQQIIGADANIQQLIHAADRQSLAQAYLFAGPRGVGKSLVARTLAAHVILSAPPCHPERSEGSNQNDNATRLITRILREQHPDVHWLRILSEKSEISVEQWRQLEARIQFQALEGDRKFIIIEDADRMSSGAANACLKTLEEPPSRTHFILISAEPDRLLATIRSRCQQMTFAPLAAATIVQWLQQQGAVVADPQRLARLAQGSLSQAAELDAEVLAQADALFAAVACGLTPTQLLKQSSDLAASEHLQLSLSCLQAMLRDTVVYAMTGAAPVHAAVASDVTAFARRVSPTQLLRYVQAVEQCRQYLGTKGSNKELILNEMLISVSS